MGPNSSANDVKEVIAQFWTKRSNTFDSEPSHVSQSEEETAAWKDILLGLISGRTGLDVLDVGTGTGFLAFLLAEMGHRVTGIDISTGMLDRAREKANQLDLEVTFLERDAERTDFDDSYFDLVISRHVLWNMPNPAQAISEWKRVVRPGGTVVVIDGLWDPDKTAARRGERWGEAYEKVLRNLPMFGGSPPEHVTALFSEQGLVNTQVRSLDVLVQIKERTLPEGMKDSYSKHRYLVVGVKEK